MDRLTTEMHLDGINVRHMGLIRSLVNHAGSSGVEAKKASEIGLCLLCEMVRLFLLLLPTGRAIH